jgi:hypothetical protein
MLYKPPVFFAGPASLGTWPFPLFLMGFGCCPLAGFGAGQLFFKKNPVWRADLFDKLPAIDHYCILLSPSAADLS